MGDGIGKQYFFSFYVFCLTSYSVAFLCSEANFLFASISFYIISCSLFLCLTIFSSPSKIIPFSSSHPNLRQFHPGHSNDLRCRSMTIYGIRDGIRWASFLSLTSQTIGEPMAPRHHWTPVILQANYASTKKSIQDTLPRLGELLQDPRDTDGKLRYNLVRSLRGRLKKWVDELKGVQSELEKVLDRNLAPTEDEKDRVEKA